MTYEYNGQSYSIPVDGRLVKALISIAISENPDCMKSMAGLCLIQIMMTIYAGACPRVAYAARAGALNLVFTANAG